MVRCWTSSPIHMTSGPTLPPAADGEGGSISPLFMPPYGRWGGGSPMLTSRLICVPVTMVSIAVLLRLCAGSIFPSVAVGEGLGQLSSLSQVTKGKWGEWFLVFNTSFILSY